jgi:hypothetical protein
VVVPPPLHRASLFPAVICEMKVYLVISLTRTCHLTSIEIGLPLLLGKRNPSFYTSSVHFVKVKIQRLTPRFKLGSSILCGITYIGDLPTFLTLSRIDSIV